MNMKILTKPISSPGRAEKYPLPLMRFLRSNVGSRSRGRSRSSPMFVLRKKTSVIETQEPTSPKVTCMGQVRVRRSRQKQKPRKRTGAPTDNNSKDNKCTPRLCKWVEKGCFCRRLGRGNLKPPGSVEPVWCTWVLCFRGSFRRKSKLGQDPLEKDSKFGDRNESFVKEHDVEQEEEEAEAAKVSVGSPSSTPPKNALLLTRCRSAPYRSSSLASRFWGEEEENETVDENRGEEENPTSGRESICGDWDPKPRLDPGSEKENDSFVTEGFEEEAPMDQIRERFVKSENTETREGLAVTVVRPLILTRCKSEPARIGDELDRRETGISNSQVGQRGKALLSFLKAHKNGEASSCVFGLSIQSPFLSFCLTEAVTVNHYIRKLQSYSGMEVANLKLVEKSV